MDSIDSGCKRDFNLGKWPISLPVLPDEALSSWILRAALSLSCEPSTFATFLWGSYQVWGHDLDRGLKDNDYDQLSEYTGISIENFRNATFDKVLPNIVDDYKKDRVILPWILTRSARFRHCHNGFQFCPQCFVEDELPYFRLYWRYAWHSVCSKHKVRLSDQCFKCLRPVQPTMLGLEHKFLCICAFCKVDLRNTPQLISDNNYLMTQNQIDQVVKDGFLNLYGCCIDSISWFKYLKLLIQLVRRLEVTSNLQFLGFAKELGVDINRLSMMSTGLSLESIPSDERYELMSAVFMLSRHSFTELVELAKCYHLKRSVMWDKSSECPDFFRPYFNCLEKGKRQLGQQPVLGAVSIKTQVLVRRKWNRFLRKYYYK